ncbi:RagB/SusD family nutrient uptake outer membrane protein [Mucilaginibacter antarcticus]|uniref:RagB/SusD family nutrient uptake outer membrane protein n=1 Tax=Mucilaginibacter antarcticus TaxID=1855725 RepID=UPI00363FBB6E
MKKHYILILLACLSLAACKKLDQEPKATPTKEAVFGTENGLKLYTNSFYNMGFLPKNSTSQDAMSDYLAVKQVPDFIREGAFGANNSSGWSWSDLRNINYFIENCTNPDVPVNIRKNYLGLARYFRAYFYMDKVKRFGDVPWINKPINYEDNVTLNAKRDSRSLVMDSVLADLDYACANLPVGNDASRTTVTKWVAYAFKSRVCLFEGTFRKYHTELNLTTTAEKWLTEAVSSSDLLIKNGVTVLIPRVV